MEAADTLGKFMGKAYAALAAAHAAGGNLDAAEECLEEMLSSLRGDAESQAEGLEALGIIAGRRNQRTRCVECLKKAFSIREKMVERGVGSRARLDKVRREGEREREPEGY